MNKEFEQKWVKRIRAAKIKYRTVMEDGRPASVLVEVSNKVDADMIVVGRRGHGGIAELVLGSVSHELVMHSKRPVLVVSSAASTATGSRSARDLLPPGRRRP